MIRIIYSLIYLALLFVAPWWLLTILGLVGILIWPKYWEAIVLAFLYDFTYGLPNTGWLKTQFNFTIIFILVFLVVEGYKKDIMFFHQ